MNRTNNIIRQSFADAEELAIEQDKEGILSLKGIVVVEGISFRISITRSASGNSTAQHEMSPPKYRYLYTGTISTLDPATTRVMLSEKKRRAKEEKRVEYKPKDIYATAKFRCDSAEPQKIAAAILNRISALIRQDRSQLDLALMRAMTPDQLSLPFAAEQYTSDFLRRAYPNAALEQNAKRQSQLQRTLSKFPATPIAKLSKRQVNAILNAIHATDEAAKLCFLFVEYLLEMRKCSGSNPFTTPGARKPSGKSALAQQELGDAVFKRLFELLNKKISRMEVIIALAASGFSLADIKDMHWDDLEIFPGFKDFIVAHIQREYAAVSKHDFSRPIISDSALLIRKALRELSADGGLAGQNIWPKDLDNKSVNNEVHNLLVRAGFAGELSSPGRPSEEDVDIPAGILQNNYKRMLYAKAGLKDDPDTYNFLCGTMYNSSTYTSYESHTSPEAALRLYQILKPLSTEKKLNHTSGLQRAGDSKDIYEVWPRTNHEVARVTARIRLKQGQFFSISCEHGAHGIIRILREVSADKTLD